ncbi:DNA repair protein RecN [Tindallia californiensis]|uniref:DNA repair protein RecN n=1 Tax=Tindallia californiensis TaxID=159292 RepID=A0A1H3NMB5_9FIRM|nr:DNA repair protein RecN [Tindallia californiensis]SDY89349.1 DNA replication and repair protein RecN [Tindallia californiensis]
MLIELDIKDFALIDHLTLSFDKGFTVLTGETGAGKSIIIDAVGLCLGGRGDRGLVKSGSDKARIQAVYDVGHCRDILTITEEYGIEFDEEKQLIVTRDLYANGKSICRINGQNVTQGILKKIMSRLINIHGQHEHQSLLDQSVHCQILDDYGGEKIKSLINDFKKHFKQTIFLKKELNRLGINDQERARQLDFLRTQIKEIDEANLFEGEEENLKEQNELLRNAQQIFKALGLFYDGVYEGGEYPSSLDLLSSNIKELAHISPFSESLEEFSNRAEDIRINLEELCRDIRAYHDQIEFSPDELERIQQRLETINHMKRKYGQSIEEILTYQDSLINELDELINSAERYSKLTKELKREEEIALSIAEKLSKQRSKTAKILENDMISILETLNMGKVSFSVSRKKTEMSGNGIDEITFLIATNPGEPLKELMKIASGGEMSRIMLAFKTLFAKIDDIPTLIFDEIDAGISGRTAQVVGEKMAYVAKTHQVICITHLPQIAALAKNHYMIEKQLSKNKTKVCVNLLLGTERLYEVGRLLNGSVTEITLEHAREMLENKGG